MVFIRQDLFPASIEGIPIAGIFPGKGSHIQRIRVELILEEVLQVIWLHIAQLKVVR